MKNKAIHSRLREFNRIMKETDRMYEDVSKKFKISNAAFWILYFLRENELPRTQSEICFVSHLPKQTVNSALKKLESDRYINMAFGDNKKSKQIVLTEKGCKLAESTADVVIAAEHRSLKSFSDSEYRTFLQLFEKYKNSVKSDFEKID